MCASFFIRTHVLEEGERSQRRSTPEIRRVVFNGGMGHRVAHQRNMHIPMKSHAHTHTDVPGVVALWHPTHGKVSTTRGKFAPTREPTPYYKQRAFVDRGVPYSGRGTLGTGAAATCPRDSNAPRPQRSFCLDTTPVMPIPFHALFRRRWPPLPGHKPRPHHVVQATAYCSYGRRTSRRPMTRITLRLRSPTATCGSLRVAWKAATRLTH